MKKQVARLQRWLDRFSKACENNRWNSAIIEADCLSAELKEIREDLWRKLENSSAAREPMFSRNSVFMSIKSLSIAIFIVMLSTVPLAVEADLPANLMAASKFKDPSAESLNWVTDEEMDMVRSLRTDLSKANVMFGSMVKEEAPKRQASLSIAKKEKNAETQSAARFENKQQKSEAVLGAEDLLALIQIGEKALRNTSPVIKIIN